MAQQPTKRPKVGVVLSGGGAKGVAHIGALKVIVSGSIYRVLFFIDRVFDTPLSTFCAKTCSF